MVTKLDKIFFAIIIVFLILTVIFWKDVKALLGPGDINEVETKENKKEKKKKKKDKKDDAAIINSNNITGSTAYILQTAENNFRVTILYC